VSPAAKSNGGWDSIHVFEALDRARTAHYKLTSTVILNLGTSTDSLGSMDLSGNMVRQVEQDMPVEDDGSHVANIGKVRPETTNNGEDDVKADPRNRWLRTWS
jgi:capping protein (actin filament) muscle Z-line, beta